MKIEIYNKFMKLTEKYVDKDYFKAFYPLAITEILDDIGLLKHFSVIEYRNNYPITAYLKSKYQKEIINTFFIKISN